MRFYIGLVLVTAILGFAFWQLAFRGGRKINGRGLGETGAAGDGFRYW